MPEELDRDSVETEDDFDTQLLCPDVIIEEKNGAIVTSNGDNVENSSSPFDYNITGFKAKFNLNKAEEILRSEIYKPGKEVRNSRLHCTACNCHLGSALNCLDNIFVHPLLTVLVCRECFDYYTGGDFDKDEDGAEMYCRWCGQGGQVFCCSKCPMVFCKLCVRINFTTAQYRAIRDSDYWECFSCNPVQIMPLKVQCYEFVKYIDCERLRVQNGPEEEFYVSIDYSQCCINGNRKKRPKNRDPDFIPYAEVSVEKNVKKPKLEKREDFGFEGFKNEEFTETAKNVNMLVPSSMAPNITGAVCSSIANVPTSSKTSSVFPPTCTPPEHPQQSEQLIRNLTLANYLYRNQTIPQPTTPTSVASISLRPILPKPQPQTALSQSQNVLRFPAPNYSIRPAFPPPPAVLNRPPLFRNIANPTPKPSTITAGEFRALLQKTREMDKHFLSVALANSTFASTVLKIYQMWNHVNNVEDVMMVYDSLQKSLKMMTDSLIDVKIRGNVGSRGGNMGGTGGNTGCDGGNLT